MQDAKLLFNRIIQDCSRHSPTWLSGVFSCVMWIFSCGLTKCLHEDTAVFEEKVNGAVCIS